MEEFFDSPEKDEREMTMMRMPLWRKLVEKDWNLLRSHPPIWEDALGPVFKELKVDLVESGPALIAMKGFPCTDKFSCISIIANFLRCAHLELDDIRNCTQQTHQHLLLSTDPEVAASANSHLDELSRRALLQFTSAQLLLGHDVVVNSPLSHPESMHQLMDLADSNRVPLIVIECMKQKNSNSTDSSSASSSMPEVDHLLEEHCQSFDSEINDLPRLVIYRTQDCHSEYEQQLVNDLSILAELFFIMFCKNYLGSNCKATARTGNESGRDGEKLTRHFSHSHPLTFISERDDHKDSAAAAAPDCRICSLPITESSYDCPQCDFSAHRSCIELPQCMSFSLHIHPLSLYVQSCKSIEPEEDIRTIIRPIESEARMKCIVCKGANRGPIYKCWQCYEFFVHQKCTQLSHEELKHPCHEHPLKLETNSELPWERMFTCRACGNAGSNIWYGCSACQLKLHTTCALELPLQIEYKCRQFHPLVLASPPKNDSDEYYCDLCEEKRHRDYWIYYCRSCEFHAHLNCVNPKIKAYDMSYDDGNGGASGNSGGSGSSFRPLLFSQRAGYDDSKDNLVGMVIAMKGGPCTGKTTLTRALAKSLRCTLVSHDDFLSCTSDTERLLSTCPSIDTLPADHLNDLSYEVLWKVTETQLHRRHSVIIDSSFHTRAHMDRLLALSSYGKKIITIMPIIIECRVLDRSERTHHSSETCGPGDTEMTQEQQKSYDTSDIPKFVIDTTSENGIEDHVTNIEMFIMSCLDKKFYGQISRSANGCFCCKHDREPDDHRGISHLPTTLKHQCHEHELTLQQASSTLDRLAVALWVPCFGCGDKLKDVFYYCFACYFYLHAKCALNLPLTNTLQSHYWHPPLVLTSHPLDPEQCYCDFCEEKRDPRVWVYSCQECEYHVDVRCADPEFYKSPDLV